MTDETFLLIDDANSWKACLRQLRQAPRMAVDIEANSLYAYREKVCLIQITTDSQDYIIDPLANFKLRGLDALLADPDIEKVFHAADYDLSLLKGLHGWEVNNLFDTMWAGRLLGFSKMGLAWFLDTLYGVELKKKYQKADWAERPLSKAKLAYARNDTHYLLRLRDDLGVRLQTAGLEAEVQEVFDGLTRINGHKRIFDPDGFWKLRGARTMPPRVQAILKALYVFREGEARRRDVPPFKVLNNQVLIRVAEQTAQWEANPPRNMDSVPGVPDKQLGWLKEQVLQVVRQALHAPPPRYPVSTRKASPGYWQRYETLLQWRKDCARLRGVESDVIMGRRTLEEIAEKNPRTAEDLDAIASLGPWRRQQYGETLLRILE